MSGIRLGENGPSRLGTRSVTARGKEVASSHVGDGVVRVNDSEEEATFSDAKSPPQLSADEERIRFLEDASRKQEARFDAWTASQADKTDRLMAMMTQLTNLREAPDMEAEPKQKAAAAGKEKKKTVAKKQTRQKGVEALAGNESLLVSELKQKLLVTRLKSKETSAEDTPPQKVPPRKSKAKQTAGDAAIEAEVQRRVIVELERAGIQSPDHPKPKVARAAGGSNNAVGNSEAVVDGSDSEDSKGRDDELRELQDKFAQGKLAISGMRRGESRSESDEKSEATPVSSGNDSTGATSNESGLTSVFSGMSSGKGSGKQSADAEDEEAGAAFRWGSKLVKSERPEVGRPAAWEKPPYEASSGGEISGKTWGHPLLCRENLIVWGPQFKAISQRGSVLNTHVALQFAESATGLCFPGPSLMIRNYKLPSSTGGADASGKRVAAKGSGNIAYLSEEMFTTTSVLNETKDAGLEEVIDDSPRVEFPGDRERLEDLLSQFAAAAGGANIFDDVRGHRDPRLILKPPRTERNKEVRKFNALVKQHCLERYLDPSHAGRAAVQFCWTRHANTATFVIQRMIKAVAERDLCALNEEFFKDWTNHILGDEESRGASEMTRELQAAIRLCGISCGWCHNLGSCNLFCKDAKCPSHQARKEKKPEGLVKAAGSKEHYQEAKNAAVRKEQSMAASAPIAWSKIGEAWQKQFVAEYAAKHTLGSGWTGPGSHSSATTQRTEGPGAYWNNQSAISGLIPMVRMFAGSSAVSMGWGSPSA